MSVERDEELLTRLGCGRPELAGLDLDEPTRRLAELLWAWRSDVHRDPISAVIGLAAVGGGR